MLSHRYTAIILFSLALIAVLPLLNSASGGVIAPWLSLHTLSALSFVGWALAIALLLNRDDLTRRVRRAAKGFGIDTRLVPLERLLDQLLADLQRRSEALSLNIVETRIESREQLARGLERVVLHAYRMFQPESVEFALRDDETGQYHSGLVVGKPFGSGSQSMLAGAEEESSLLDPQVVVQPVAFAGNILGTIRIRFGPGKLPGAADREVVRLLALQGAVALVNSRFTEELMRMRHASDESVRVKTGFLANLSHEIRGPLGIMMNAVELVLDGLCGELTGEQRETLSMLKSNGDHLLDLINDVLDYAKVESGKITAEPVDIAVGDLLTEMSGVVGAQALAKGHRISIRKSDEALALHCDRRHIRQIMINLLTNAIKYTPNGGTIELWAERVPGNRIRVNVRDTGVGIEPKDRSRVFAAFERIENSYSVTQVGTGLGMSLTRRLIEVNGGNIDFDSMPGKGSTFWFTLPAVEFTPFTALEDESPADLEARGQGERIFILERDPAQRDMLARYLKHVGFAPEAFADHLALYEKLSTGAAPALIVLDNSFLESKGALTMQELRRVAGEHHLRVLLLSSRAFLHEIERHLKQGVDRHLTRPVALREVGNACAELIGGRADVRRGAGSAKSGALDETIH